MSASFIDNKNNEVFDVVLEEYKFENQVQVQIAPDSSTLKFINFIESKIKWTETYPLDPPETEIPVTKTEEQIRVSGKYKIDGEGKSFTGIINIEKRENHMFYSWTLLSMAGELLAGKSEIISFKKIPNTQDEFDFTKGSAVKKIREYKIGNDGVVSDITID